MKSLYLIFLIFTASLSANQFYYEFGKKVEVLPKVSTMSTENTTSDILEYQTTDGKTLRFKNEILITCKKDAYCEDDFSDLNLTNYKKIFKNIYLITLSSNDDIFEMCQKLYEKDDIEIAHPNYVRNIIAK